MTDKVIETLPLDPLATPLFDELQTEYFSRYRDFLTSNASSKSEELARHEAGLFVPPDGIFILVLREGEVVAGGAFKRYDATTAELKRIWASSRLRRQGLARLVVSELERRAVQRGYRRVYLTTGFRQPEAVGLYRDSGYEPLYDQSIAPEIHFRLPFGKDLLEPGRKDSLADLRAPGPLGLPPGIQSG